MNKIKIFTIGVLSLAIMVGVTSCGDEFLNEELTTSYNTQYLQTEEGIQYLATALYANIRWHYGYEWAYAITQYGCDEFTNGSDLTSEAWNKYDARLGAAEISIAMGAANKNCPNVGQLWDEMYYGISTANLVINNAPNITDEEIKNKCLGEAYFLRGYNYYRLFAQYGGVVLQLKPSEGVVRNFTRSTAEATLNQVISDLRNAYELLPETEWRGEGTWTKPLGAHMLAKALLFRCSERCEDWNSSYLEADLDTIVNLCDYTISKRPLVTNFRDLWAWTGVDCSTENNSEILMSCQHNADATTTGRFGNRIYSFFNPQFSNWSGWVKRGAWIGLDFQRCRPTEYNYSTYDNVNDSRLWKSFRTVYNANQANTTKNPSTTALYNTAVGDIGILFLLNKSTDTRFDGSTYGILGKNGVSTFVNPKTGKDVPNAFALYKSGQYVLDTYNLTTSTCNIFCGLSKFEDGSRSAEKTDSYRDVIMARTGETYLIKAEALARKGNYPSAINVVNQLRARAQWKEGEDREAYTDGTAAFESNSLYTANTTYYKAFSKKNSYYLSTGVDSTTSASSLQITSYQSLPAEDEAILTKLGVTGDKARLINFILNERTRELNGEFLRWEDLSRTKTLIKRAQTFNEEAATFVEDATVPEKHLLRAIPQSFIDGLLNDDGSNLTDEQKAAWQNPGY
jgi:starch-binding outer membrane protein, SusD/RagB family